MAPLLLAVLAFQTDINSLEAPATAWVAPEVLDLHRDNFDDVLTANESVLVHFWAPWSAASRGPFVSRSGGSGPCGRPNRRANRGASSTETSRTAMRR